MILLAVLFFSALLLLVVQVLDEDDDDDPLPGLAGRGAVLSLHPGETVEDLFRVMRLAEDAAGPCAAGDAAPLLVDAAVAPGALGCVRLRNAGDAPGLWRIDFEGPFSAGYTFEMEGEDGAQVVLDQPPVGGPAGRPVLADSKRVASLPIVLLPGGASVLSVRIDDPADLADADPVLRPEAEFDRAMRRDAQGMGALLGAGALLLAVLATTARLVRSRTAGHFAAYLGATLLAAAVNAGYLNGVFPGNPALPAGALGRLFGAAQLAAHMSFMAAFVDEALPGAALAGRLRRAGLMAGAAVLLLAGGTLVLSDPADAARFLDLGFELDPLIEDPLASLPRLIAAAITLAWIGAIIGVSAHLLRRDVSGSRLFALGGGILSFGLLSAGLGIDAFDPFDDNPFGLQFVLLLDGLIFAAAMTRQAFGLRGERDRALRKELEATRERQAMAERLLKARKDADRSRTLAETHRNRLALTGHDLRQPLTSLHLAVREVERTNPPLSKTLRTSLDYIGSVLNATVDDTRPDDLSEDEGQFHTETDPRETIEVALLLHNAVRMFADEAAAKGLTLTHESSDLVVETVPVTIIRILSNLVSNAVKYTQNGGVVVRARTQGDTATIEVQDTGAGLSPDEIERIQQDYTRGSAAAGVHGDGLGLSSARDFAAELGLSLKIRSTVGEGTCVSIEGLPLARAG